MVKLSPYFQKQKLMTRVWVSLLPLLVFSIYLFGFRTLFLLAVVLITGIASEYAFMRLVTGDKTKVSEAVLVSCLLFTLSLPPATPYWVAMVGIAFGIIFGKAAFGGFGKNIFNPALVGRCMIYIAFPSYMTVNWSKPFTGFPGGLIQYSGGVDVMTMATPILDLNNQGIRAQTLDLFTGFIPGSLGETSSLLILLAAIYLLMTKTASWKIMTATAASFLIGGTILYTTGVVDADPVFMLLSGGFLYGTVFMTTDPVSAPSHETSKWLYGILIGLATLVIRSFSLFTEGIMFAILIANSFAPLIDRQVKLMSSKKKVNA
ncbi:MAG: RnfABCDGE type electron transport complex subunit D [Clostridia bacterium]|nr:RnfABCDGE type electron transport complex subunit D [Clostridia bacterium]NCC75187.1 RnfABCDGE type electron transport complex subunit D [Clostridia bacterium]